MGRTVLITGATSGIGKATAQVLAKEGFQLILCGRRQQRLDELQTELATLTKVTTLNFDVSDKQAVAKAFEELPSDFQTIDILINNAGNAHGLGTIDQGNTDDWDKMMDINVKGLLYVSRQVIPGMVSRAEGHIVNIGSIAGIEVYAEGNVYCASKHAVDAITKGMRIDLNPQGIKVSEVKPGLVETEFSEVRFKGDSEKAAKVYQGYQPLLPQDIAELILFMITRPKDLNLAVVLVLPLAEAASIVGLKR